MNKINISIKDRRWVGFLLSFLILSAVFSIMGDITHKVMTVSTVIKGTVYEYTLDSVYVDIDWLVEYNHSIYFTDVDLLEMRIYINQIMKKDIKKLINDMFYQEYCILNKTKQINSDRNTKIIIFN